MSWQEDREKWNQEGLCAREACKAEMRQCFQHPTTKLLYCKSCTWKLQDAQSIVMPEVGIWTVVNTANKAVLAESIHAANPKRARVVTGLAEQVAPDTLRAFPYRNLYAEARA